MYVYILFLFHELELVCNLAALVTVVAQAAIITEDLNIVII